MGITTRNLDGLGTVSRYPTRNRQKILEQKEEEEKIKQSSSDESSSSSSYDTESSSSSSVSSSTLEQDVKENGYVNESGLNVSLRSERYSLRRRSFPSNHNNYTPKPHKRKKNKASSSEKFVRRSGRKRALVSRFDPELYNNANNNNNNRKHDIYSNSQKYHNTKRRKKNRNKSSRNTYFMDDSSDYVNTETEFWRREERRRENERNKIQPLINYNELASGPRNNNNYKQLADIDSTNNNDNNTTWESIGGLDGHVSKLKEMIMLPLLYPNIFDNFNINPPRGVLFYGPPGTGKTLCARALANSASTVGRKVSFFFRKGADCLSKWVGEAERQLRLLFEQATKMQPSIIFFDEIDGLAPVRNSQQDQIHSSIVSTLLALMDGLESRGQVIVIGATNRLDSIDPALRRPGRFDRELMFALPSLKARKSILSIHTKNWNPKLNDDFITELATKAVGYCGADLKALCTEATLNSIRRIFPEIYSSTVKLDIDINKLVIKADDFHQALKNITPAAHRSSLTASNISNSLSKYARSLIDLQIDNLIKICTRDLFPLSAISKSDKANQDVTKDRLIDNNDENFNKKSYQPRILIQESDKIANCQSHLAHALLQHFEGYPVHYLDLPSIIDAGNLTIEETIVKTITSAQRSAPSILYWPNIYKWWSVATDSIKEVVLMTLDAIPKKSPVLLLCTIEKSSNLSSCPRLESLIEVSHCRRFTIKSFDLSLIRKKTFNILKNIIKSFLNELIQKLYKDDTNIHNKNDISARPFLSDNNNIIEKSEIKKNDTTTKFDSFDRLNTPIEEWPIKYKEQLVKEENIILLSFRKYLRSCIEYLIKKFYIFLNHTHNLNNNINIILPMDLSQIREKNNLKKYLCASDFLKDIDLILNNYINDQDVNSSKINKAYSLQDEALTLMHQMNKDLAYKCHIISDRRKRSNYYHIYKTESTVFNHIKPKDNEYFVRNHKISEQNTNINTPQHKMTTRSLVNIPDDMKEFIIATNDTNYINEEIKESETKLKDDIHDDDDDIEQINDQKVNTINSPKVKEEDQEQQEEELKKNDDNDNNDEFHDDFYLCQYFDGKIPYHDNHYITNDDNPNNPNISVIFDGLHDYLLCRTYDINVFEQAIITTENMFYGIIKKINHNNIQSIRVLLYCAICDLVQ